MPWYVHESSPKAFFVADHELDEFLGSLEGSQCDEVTDYSPVRNRTEGSKTMAIKFTDEEITKLKAMLAALAGEAPPAGDEPEPPAEPEDDLADKDRKALKAIIVDKELDVKFTIKTSDDELRDLIRAAGYTPEGAEPQEPEPPTEPEVELKKNQIVKFKVKGKTHSGKVKEIDYDAGKVKVMSDTDKKSYELTPDELFA